MSSLLRPKSFFNLFPAPEYLLLATSGVSIADKGIKFVEFHRGIFGNKVKITRAAKSVLAPGVVESGFIRDQGVLVKALQDLSRQYDISYTHATLPEEKAYLFTATIDRVPFEGLRDAVAFIVEENVPVSLPESVFDFEVIDKDPSSPTIKVVVSVLPRKVVDNYIQAFESAGMTPVSFDLESQAIARTIIPEGDRRTQLIINWGEKRTGFYVVEDEVVQFSTTPIHGAGAEGMPPSMHDLKAEMHKVFAFWNTRSDKQGVPAKPIESVLLCGAAASNNITVEEFMSECPVPHKMADPWANFASAPEQVPTEVNNEPLTYLSAIGSALPKREKTYV